jgi:hypothetical protein
MKYCSILLVCFLLMVGSAMGQKKSLRKFYREQKRYGHASTFRIGLGRVTFKLASWIIPNSVLEQEGVNLKQFIGKVNRLKVYIIEGSQQDTLSAESKPMMRLQRILTEKEHFEQLVEVRHQGSIIHMMNKGEGTDVGNLVILVQDNADFVVVHLKSRLKMEDINQLVQQLAKN